MVCPSRYCRTLIPPSQAKYLFPSTRITNEHPEIDPRAGKYDVERYPDLDLSAFTVVEQGTNEAIFVPSGWYHHVENMNKPECSVTSTDSPKHNLTISVNHNWFNVFSIFEVFQFLIRDLNAVRDEISHLRAAGENEQNHHQDNNEICRMNDREWHVHCEVLLKANSSLGLLDFIGIISARILMYIMHHENAQRDNNIVDLEKEQYLQWRHYLCPWYDINHITTLDIHDIRCLELLLNTDIREEWVNLGECNVNCLSHFIPASTSPTSINQSKRIYDGIHYPVKALKFSVFVVRNLLNIILEEFPELVAHIDASRGSRSGEHSISIDNRHYDICVDGTAPDASYVGHGCDNYRDAVRCLNSCISLVFSAL